MTNVFRRVIPVLVLPLVAAPLCAQGRGAAAREPAFNLSSNPLLSSFRFRSIGPASMGGRIDDIEVAPSDPNVIYVGYAVGGVFKSSDNAVSFQPIFQTYGSASIGDIAIHPTNPNIVYSGTAQGGLYRSMDGGTTWVPLFDSQLTHFRVPGYLTD